MRDDGARVTPRPAEVFVISVNGSVQLLVDGAETPENQSLVDEMRSSFVATGTPADHVEVVWEHRR